MTDDTQTAALRRRIRDETLTPEADLAAMLVSLAALSEDDRNRARTRAAEFVRLARANASRSGLIDKFLQEYGLSTAEGVTLMRLAEALLRTPDAATANALIEDKIEAGDWAAHKGKSPFPLVNFSTRALMLTAAWLDDEEAQDPLRRMARATKEALDRLGEPVIRASVAQAMRVMGEHFVLGETIDAAIRRGRRYEINGYRFSFDMLGEAAHTADDADRYFHDYEAAIAAIAEHAESDLPRENPGISVKLSALHPRYEYAKKDRVRQELGARTRQLARLARAANIGFNIDAEEADRLDLSLDIIDSLVRDPTLADWPGLGVVVQAYQRRAPFVLDWLADAAREQKRRIMVRLVKGAYWDGEIKRAQVMGLESYPVFTRKVMTDLSYVACARKILSSTDAFYPQFATHNALTATTVMEIAGDYSDYEFQRLHGMGEALHDSLLEAGARSRIYAPVGGHKELLPYLVRRLLENGANSSFVNQLIDPDLSVDDIVADPIDEIADLDVIANPHIPAPRDHLGGRLAAQGWDDTDPATASRFEACTAAFAGGPNAAAIVDGKIVAADAVARAPVLNPAFCHQPIGAVATATVDDVARACRAAKDFAPVWRDTPAQSRADALRRAALLLEQRGEDFMTLAVKEAGKTWPDAIAEVREAVDFLRYYADQSALLSAPPLGVVACISPWNFPLAIFLGQVSAALAAGNCVVCKPAEQTPLIAFEAVKLLHEAGIPGAALHFLPGEGANVGAPLVDNDAVAGVVFTGSTQTAKRIHTSLADAGRSDVALIAETGGINAMIIDSTALLEQAVSDTVSSAFQSAGQRCSACRVVCVQRDIFDRFEPMLVGAMAELRIGDPALLKTDVGPVIDGDAHASIQRHIARLEKTARLIARAPAPVDVDGAFISPVAFEIASLSELSEEIFGPVLHVVRFDAETLSALIDDINALGYGLTMGVHTRIDETMNAISRRARVGNLYVNRNQIGAVVGVQPFGGEGLSGTGPKAGGPHYLDGLTRRPNVDSVDGNGGDGAAALSASALDPALQHALDAAASTYGAWNGADREAVIAALCEAATGFDDATKARAIAFSKASTGNLALPGPTGEANTLKLRGRGVAVCLGPGDAETACQALLAMAAGNIAIARDNTYTRQLIDALADAGAPDGVLVLNPGDLPRKALLHPETRLVVFDGAADDRHNIDRILSTRDGALAPIVSTRDAVWRFGTERTLTINTTAAGGDVRLLSLGE